MGLFRYKAIAVDGKALHGVIEADSLEHAKEKLWKEQVYTTALNPVGDKVAKLHLKGPQLLRFTQELAQLLQAGLPLYESLVTIEEKHKRKAEHPLFLDLCDHLKVGKPLSMALQRYPQTFDQIYLSMVQAGEESGQLATVFAQLTQLIDRGQKMRKKLISTFAYPAFLGGFCLLIVGILLFFIIPSLSELLEGRMLHPLTMSVLQISRFANEHTGSLSLLLLAIIGGFVAALRSPLMKMRLQSFSLKVPMLGEIQLQSSLVRFLRATSMLLHGGVPLLKSLSLARPVLKNGGLEASITTATQRIIEGQALSQALAQETLWPPLVLRVVSLAEETGRMPDAFSHLTTIYEEDLEKNLSQLLTVLQPALLIVLGGVVGFVILSILLPLTDVGSLVQ